MIIFAPDPRKWKGGKPGFKLRFDSKPILFLVPDRFLSCTVASFLLLGWLSTREAVISGRHSRGPTERASWWETGLQPTAMWLTILEAEVPSPGRAFRCSPASVFTAISWETHGRTVASRIQPESHMATAPVGPHRHLLGVETGCTASSMTRKSTCMQWTNPIRSADTTKTAKDLWSEEKGHLSFFFF